MPWKTVKPMDQKIQIISDWLSEQYCKIDLSKKYCISRPTVDKWINRYLKIGLDGLKDLKREPKNKHQKTPEQIIQRIIEFKTNNYKRGPKKIYSQLTKEQPKIKWPSPSTIGYWLKKHGLTIPRKRFKRVAPYNEPFIHCKEPNDVWSADYKGQFLTKDKYQCYPLTISDNYSRYLIKCQGLRGPRHNETREVFKRAFREKGLPKAIRTDNGTPFSTPSISGLSRLSIWWIELGIIPERIEKGCPQQNGRHERMHRTLKYETLDRKAKNIKEQQKQFDLFQEDYNYHRPHEALGQRTPSDYYQGSQRPYVETPKKPDYGAEFNIRKVRNKGEILFEGRRLFLTNLLSHKYVGLKQISDECWDIYYYACPIAVLSLRKNKIFSKV
jgi:transposase InsO family protein